MNNLFDRVVDFATIGTALMVGYDFFKRLFTPPPYLVIKGYSYHQSKGDRKAQVEFLMYSTERVRIKSVKIKGRNIAFDESCKFGSSILVGHNLDKDSGDFVLPMVVDPAPKNGEPLILKINLGGIFYYRYDLFPGDFSSSGIPDFGEWPTSNKPRIDEDSRPLSTP